MSIFRRLIPTQVSTPFKFSITVGAGGLFTLPIADYGILTPNFSVNWGDSSSNVITSSTSPNKAHTYTSAGTYQITITGFCPVFIVNNTSAIRSLIISIDQWGTVGFRQLNFYGCNNVSSLPTDYIGLQDVEIFSNFMRSTGLTTIPSGIFDNSTVAINFSDAFSFTQITSIPTNLFKYNTAATSFNSTFNTCTALVTCPSTLFDTNINVVNMSGTFRFCTSLTSVLQFNYNTAVTTFASVYQMPTTSNALTGTAPTLWTRNPTPTGTAAFRNCTGLTNYASIPSNWK